MKYIIELEDDIKYLIINGRADNRCYTLVRPVEELEILNSDYINEHYGDLQDEAYQRGHDDGYEAGCATVFKPVSDAAYQRGLDEAMNAFKKLYSCGWERDWKAMGFEFDDGEWSTSFEYIIDHYTAAEIVEKVKAYEDKHSDRIEAGDIVDRYIDGKFDSRGIYLGGNGEIWDCLFWANTLPITLAYPKGQFKKTGKHYDIQSILEAMRT